MKNFRKNALIWIVGFILLTFVFNLFQGQYPNDAEQKINFSQLFSKVEAGEVASLKIQGNNIEGQTKGGKPFSAYGGFDQSELLRSAYAQGVQIDIMPPNTKGNLALGIFVSWFPTLLFIGVWLFFMKQMNGAGGKGGAFGFGKSKAKALSENAAKVTFNDVAGIDEAKEEMYEMVEFLREPIKFQKLGGRIPRGCLLVGAPGTGKTLLARAIAGEANVPFFSISGSDFVEMFVGVGASRVRDMFEQAKKNSPCIIFIDEIDAIGKNRGGGAFSSGNDEREQTLNQMLVEMDGFDRSQGVIVIAATNRPDVLDSALLRPGRFDRQIYISLPNIKGREEIIKLYLSKIKASSNVDTRLLARATPGFSGAELSNLINEAALKAARANKNEVSTEELREAKDKIVMGVQKKGHVLSEDERKLTAYHESGHALVSLFSDNTDPIYKITIIPAGMALGMVVKVPESDKFYISKAQIEDDIAVAMGGRVAEEMIFGKDKITTGASSDIKAATKWAKGMVEQWGMSDNIGTIDYGKSNDIYKYGDNYYSDAKRQEIDNEVTRIVKQGYDSAMHILTKHIALLHKLASKLLEVETMTGEEVIAFLGLEKSLTGRHDLVSSSIEGSTDRIAEAMNNTLEIDTKKDINLAKNLDSIETKTSTAKAKKRSAASSKE